MNNGFYEFSRGKQQTTSPVFPFTGSALITGSLGVTGIISATQGFTGSLFGTSSWAVSASWAPTQTITTSSLVTTSSFNSFTSSYNTGSFTGSFTGTSSFATNALTASYLSGYVSPFPYTGSAQITGSLGVTGSLTVENTTRQVVLRNPGPGASGQVGILAIDGTFTSKTVGTPVFTVNVLDSSETVKGGIVYTKASNSATNTSLNYNSSANTAIYISGSGNVGIGTTTPQHTLDVNGSTRISNGLTVTGSILGHTATLGNSDVAGNITVYNTYGSPHLTLSRPNQDSIFNFYNGSTISPNVIDSINNRYLDINSTTQLRLSTVGQSRLNINQSGTVIVNPTGSLTGSVALQVSGSTLVTGSVVVTGSISATQGFTGSLFGTSSWAVSASYTVSGGNQNLQQVLDNGFTASNKSITLTNTANNIRTFIGSEGFSTFDLITNVGVGGSVNNLYTVNGINNITIDPNSVLISTVDNLTTLSDGTLSYIKQSGGGSTYVSFINPTAGNNLYFPDKTDTIATLGDIPNTSSFATTGSNTFQGTQTITGSNGRLIYTGTTPGIYPTLAEVHINNDYPWLHRFYNDTFSTSSAVMAYFGWNDGRFVFHNESTQSIGLQVNGYSAENGLLVYQDKVAFVNNVEVTGSLLVSGSITGSLFGTASFATNAATASNILGGKATHIPFFKTDTTLATSSLYQSGSSTVIINQDNATTANPEALYVWQPHPTSFNVISGKGDINNYLQLNIQNTNQGVSASSDVVATANNGNETTNYIDMGINSQNYNVNFIGNANDAYLYSTGNDLHIGNASNFPVQIFAGGNDVDVHNKLILNPNNRHSMSGSLEMSGSLNVRNSLTSSGLLTNGTNTILGNTVISGSSTIQGTTTLTGSLLITGSTTQRGNNTLLGDTTLSGSVIISGSLGSPANPNIKLYGDVETNGVVKFLPVTANINTSLSGSYIYVSGSTNDLYFSQNGSGYSNVTRLRWLEGNLYTGLLNGGIITTQSSTVYQINSGSGIVVNLNASYNDNPYPTVTYVNWPNLSASIAPLSASYDQSFVSVEANGTIFAQGTPYTDGQFNTLIPIGIVIHQNRSTINAVQTFPSVAYGWKQRSNDFIKAFGPVKISGYTLSPSGSSTGSLVLTGGVSFVDGRNYIVDPNNPSYISELTGITTSKIYRYYQSGSAAWAYDTNAGAGYATIDPTRYSNNGVLTALANNNKWSIQRVFYFPNSATKAFYIYYGNAEYDTKADAIAALTTEPFNEAPNTAANALFIGYLLLQKTADFTSAATYEIRSAGLFRGSGTAIGGGSATTSTLAGLSDVSITSLANHNLLAYNSSTTKWENVSTITANVTGTATTASYISPTFISASAAASGFGSGGGGDTSGLLSTASFNTYTSSNTSQFAGTASFATTAQNLLGSVTSAATASYSTNFTVANSLTLDGTLIDYSSVNSSAVGNNNLYQIATGSYTSAFTKYTVSSGANARAGEFVTVWNGTDVVSYDNSTTDIGNTSDVTFVSSIVTSQIKIDAVTATSAWKIKSTTTFI